MHAHHEQVIRRLTELFAEDPLFPALIVGGSIAKGLERPDSDVDVLLVATDDEYRRREQSGELWYYNPDVAGYPGGYVDGKVINRRFLEDAADHGSEPARDAFVGAYPAYARLPGLDDLIARIPVYPEHERGEKIVAFYSQVQVMPFFVREAEKRDDLFLLSWAASTMTFFGGRLILAHNRILFPSHTRLMERVASAPDKPDDFARLAQTLLRDPSSEMARAFRESLDGFQPWGITYAQALARYIKDSEWNWMAGRPPLSDC